MSTDLAARAGARESAARPDPKPAVDRRVRENRALLDTLLSEAVRYLDGDAAADQFERAIGAGDHGAGGIDFATLSAEDAGFLARAFACRSLLANIAEDVAGRRRFADFEAEPSPDRPRTLPAAVAALEAAGEDRRAIRRRLDRLRVVPVLTAHPTEMRRRSVVEREVAIANLLSIRAHRLPRRDEAAVRADLFREIAVLWKTRLHRPERITVDDEIRNTLAIVGRSILPAIQELYRRWGQALDRRDLPAMLGLGSWLGGDRDGHPGVNAHTLRYAFHAQARLLSDLYLAEIRKLEGELSLSCELTPFSERVAALAEASGDTLIHRRDEPYRRAVIRIAQRLRATLDRLTGHDFEKADAYRRPSDFAEDLEALRDSLVLNGGERLVGPRLKNLVELVRVCGFHLQTVDLRQNADVHERTLHELFAKVSPEIDYLDLDEAGRVELLTRELSNERPLRSPFARYSEETSRELDILDAAAEIVARFGARALGSYVISKAASVSDMLEPLVLLKQAGLVEGGKEARASLPVSPLFETIGDLKAGPGILEAWFALPVARALLATQPAQEVMLGYSDSNKDGGYVASRWNLWQASCALAETCEAAGAAMQLFHGRGGSIGRGGGSVSDAVLAQPPGAVQGRIRITEQGEMISRRFGDEPTARRNLDAMVAATLMASSKAIGAKGANGHADLLSRLGEASFAAYRGLIYDDPAFEDFFWAATPIAEIAALKIGSRPASRTPSRRIEDLRAIPWVFSWSQSRMMLPGFYGFAAGVEAAGLAFDELKAAAEGFEFFGSLISNMELDLAQSDMDLAERYAALAPDRDAAERIFGRIRDEWAACRDLVLKLKGTTRLLQDQPELLESVELNRRQIEPLNRLQLELMSRRRQGDESEAVRLGIQLTVNGIAAGLRNTG